MKILVTGGAGYKGLKLVQALLEAGHDVTVLDNFLYGVEPALFLFSYPKISFVRKDIRNLEPSDVSGFDCVYHLAAISGLPACAANPHSAETINVEATRNLVSFLSKSQLLILASTTSLYGKTGDVSTEETPVNPISVYGKNKVEAEKICMDFGNTVTFRFATLFGVSPRMRWDLLTNDFVRRAIQERSLVIFDSQSIRTFLHLDDTVTAYLMALDRTSEMVGQKFNVGCEWMNFSKRELAEKIKEFVDYEIIDSSLADVDQRNFVINFDKITALGYEPTKTMDEGIRELVELFRFYRPAQAFNLI